ncbi:aldehyde dehydrogenase [Novosphingobium bradum]|uniref:Aldehyde dehydrogenase n=1 Tax=Novosphingobium bradum TaxID=1737444 RepID=A0ABV7ISV7_9SPHN
MTTTGTPAPVAHPGQLFIDGQWVEPSSAARMTVFDSTSEDVFLEVAEAQVADMERAIAAARTAFDNGPWPSLTHAERATYLRAISKGIMARAEDIARIWTAESGILYHAAVGAAQRIAKNWADYADLAETYPFYERRTPSAGGEFGLLVREPVGVVGAIVAWNVPLLLITHKVAPALLAGCTTIVKASPEAPGAAWVLAEICQEAGLPAGVINVVAADREVSEMLVRDPRVDKISFTGSTGAGRRIASLCGERIARCTLELGGKSAAVILDDYDVERAAADIASRATFLAGQVCSSLTRVIVTRHRHDALLDALAGRFAEVVVGDPMDPASQMGPLATAIQRDRVEGHIAGAKADGATLATGGARPAHLNRGYFMEPTVFGHVDNSWAIAQQEVFGPVLSVIPAADEAEAVRLANDTIFGLNNAVFTNDLERAYAVARQLRSGTVGHNIMRSDLGVSFGGFKQSGLGREGGSEGLANYLETKFIILDGEPRAVAGL